LLHTKTQDEFGTWGMPGRKPQIVYGNAVMSALAAEAQAAGRRPIGGVLFGTTSDTDTRILAFRAIDCQDADTGGAPFSEAGEEALGRLAEVYSGDLALTGLQPVGWYRSRWESGIQLNHDDLRVWNRFFSQPAQISLVLRVQENSPVRAGFFFRPQHGGPVRIDSSYRTFEIHSGPGQSDDMGRLAEAVEAGGWEPVQGAAPAEPAPASELIRIEPPSELFTLPDDSGRRRRVVWGMVAAAAALSMAAGAWWSTQGGRARAGESAEIVLRFRGPSQRLVLSWDARAPQIQQAEWAELRLIDGQLDSTALLDRAALARGERPVANSTGLIEAQMRIHPRDPKQAAVMAAANFVGPAGGEVVTEVGDDTALRAEVSRLETMLGERGQARSVLEARVRELRRSAEAAALPPATGRAVPPPVASPQPATPKPEPAAMVRAEPPASTVEPAEGAARPQPQQAPAGPAFGNDRAPARGPVGLPEPPAAPAYNGPASGKFIWTGYLPPGKTVTIDGRRASTGSVNGSLPGVPVRISVYPGEFSSSGLSVFSAAARHQSAPVTENRSAQNGWLNTRYVYDPARARDATLAAAPGEASGFKQLQIAGGERPVSVVVVEWSVIR